MSKPLFEHRHFVWLADFCAEVAAEVAYYNLSVFVTRMLADKLASTNPNFDRQRFLEAASGNPNGKDRV